MNATYGFLAVLLLFWAAPSHQSVQDEAGPKGSQNKPALQQFINDTLHLIADGEQKIPLNEDHKDLVLVIGMTGAGKTTMTKFIASMELLESYKAGARYLIRDKEDKISQNQTIVSKTIFPDRIIDNSSNTVFYDMPGFSDTRNTSIELANAWFMRKVAEHARRVKILLIVSHSTLQSGEHRDIILTLLDYVADFIPDPAKFKDAICMVISKVRGQRSQVIQQTSFIRGVADFLIDVRSKLDSVKGLSRLKGKRDLIDALLSQDTNGTYNRIAFFKQPKAAGPLLNMTDMVEQREFIKSVIEDSTVYVEKSPGDFGISVSAEAQSLSYNLTQIIANNLSLSITGIQEKIRLHFQLKLANSSLSSLGKTAEEVEKLEEMPAKLSIQTSLQDFLLTFISLLADLQVEALQGDLLGIRNQLENLQFFENVTGAESSLNFYEWIKPLKIGIQKVRANFQQTLASVNDDMVGEAEVATRTLRGTLEDQLNQPGAKDMLALSEKMSSLWAGTRDFVMETYENARKFNEFASRLDAFLAGHGLQFETRMEEDLKIEGADCEFNSPLKLIEWLAPFKALQKSLRIESLKLRLQNHRDQNQEEMDGYRSSIGALERNLTSQVDSLALEAGNLKIQNDHETEAWEAKLSQQRSSCERDRTNSMAAHSQNLTHLQSLHEQVKSDLELKIRREQRKREELRSKCRESHDAIRESIRREGEQQVGRLASVATNEDAVDVHERLMFTAALAQATDACEGSLTGEGKECMRKLDSQKLTFDTETERLEKQVAQKEKDCRQRLEEEISMCKQQSEALIRQNKVQEGNLQSRLGALELSCSTTVLDQNLKCDETLARLAITSGHEVQALKEELAVQENDCRRKIDEAARKTNKMLSLDRETSHHEIVGITKACEAKISEIYAETVLKLKPYRKLAGVPDEQSS